MHHTNISKTIVCDRYQIIDVLGKGAVGITYSAIDLQTQEQERKYRDREVKGELIIKWGRKIKNKGNAVD